VWGRHPQQEPRGLLLLLLLVLVLVVAAVRIGRCL
jgi:hypothetical protein